MGPLEMRWFLPAPGWQSAPERWLAERGVTLEPSAGLASNESPPDFREGEGVTNIRPDERALESERRSDLSFVLENDPTLVPPLVALLSTAAAQHRLFDEETRNRVEIALHEAMLNGIYHGNLGMDSRAYHDPSMLAQDAAVLRNRPPYQSRRLHVRAQYTFDEAVFTIRDEGLGFDPAAQPDPTETDNLSSTCGRGLLLIRTYLDEVRFNETGNEIILRKRRTLVSDENTPGSHPIRARADRETGVDHLGSCRS